MPLHTLWKGLVDTIHHQTDSSIAYEGAASQALRCLQAIYGFAILDYIAFMDLFCIDSLHNIFFCLLANQINRADLKSWFYQQN